MPPTGVLKNALRKSLFFEAEKLKVTKLSNGSVITPGMNSINNLIHDKEFLDFLVKCLE